MKRAFLIVGVALGVAGCGQVAPLKPAPGQAMPVKPLLASETPSVSELLALPTQAKPKRVDELLTKSQPREPDRFDLPPPDGAAVPPEGTDDPATPSTTGPDNEDEPR